MNPRSLVFRLGAWYTLLLSIMFLLVAAACFYGLRHYLHMNLRDSLKRRSAQLQQMLMQLPADAANAVVDREIANRVAPEINNRFLRITRDGTLIYRSGVPSNHSFDPSTIPPAPRAAAESRPFATAVLRDQHLMIMRTAVTAASGRYLIEIGVSQEPIEAALERLLDVLGLRRGGRLFVGELGSATR
jgi:hypothetical protein